MEIKLYHIEINVNTYASYDDYVKQHKEIVSLSKILPQFEPLPLTEPDEGYCHRIYFDGDVSDKFIVTPEEMLKIVESNIKFKMKGIINKEVNLAKTFEQIGTKFDEQIEANVTQNTYNNKCEVHMPGNMLASYNELMLVEDACTDVIQSHISSGFRIVTVCPQPDQRRPDYILGRFNPERMTDDAAKRG